MHSKPLRQTIDITLDTMGMSGPVKRRDVAEAVMRSTPDEYWAEADKRDARLAYIQSAVTTRMNEVHSPEYVGQYLHNVPKDVREALTSVPRFICITPRGGRDAVHVLAVMATPDQWLANFNLKNKVVEATTQSRERSRDMHDLLAKHAASCLLDLFACEAAE